MDEKDKTKKAIAYICEDCYEFCRAPTYEEIANNKEN